MQDNRKGILLGLIAACVFAINIAVVKVAAVEYHILQILFIRQVFVFISTLPAVASDFPDCFKTEHPGLHIIRLSGAFIGLLCGIWAVSVLPLTTATTLAFSQVFFIAILAAYFLGEVVGRHRIAAVLVGFLGVFIAMRPGVDGLINPYSLIAVLGALGAAVAMTTVRRLSQQESTATILVYQALFVGLLAALPLYWFWTTPDGTGWALLISVGLLSAVGQWVGIQALRVGEASVVGNTEYTKLIYATFLGLILFAELPDIFTIIGAMLIVGSSIYIYRREAHHKKT